MNHSAILYTIKQCCNKIIIFKKDIFRQWIGKLISDMENWVVTILDPAV